MEQNVFLGAGKGEWCMSPLFIGLLAIVLLVVFGVFWRNVLQGRFSFSTREWGFKSLSFASLGLGTVLIFLQLAQVLGDFRLLLLGVVCCGIGAVFFGLGVKYQEASEVEREAGPEVEREVRGNTPSYKELIGLGVFVVVLGVWMAIAR